MIPEDSGLEIGCKVNGKQQFICKLECPEGTNFMGKDGKRNFVIMDGLNN